MSAARDPYRGRDHAVGTMVGLAVGDALGAPHEFMKRDSFRATGYEDGGPHRLRAGQWTDDTAMAMCLADSLLRYPGFDRDDCLGLWVRWWTEGYNSCTGECFDIGNQTREALRRHRMRLPLTASPGEGNGGIMRLAPAAVRHHSDVALAVEVAGRQSGATHSDPALVCESYAARLAADLCTLMRYGPAYHLGVRHRHREEVRSTGRVSDTYDAACWAVETSVNFEEAVLKAVNLGDDADTVGAVTGQLAGAKWGYSGIPTSWLRGLAWHDTIVTRAGWLYDAGARGF